MNTDQTITLAFLLLGIVAGLFSFYVDILLVSVIGPIVLYAVANIALLKRIKAKRTRQIVSNTGITFFSIWLIIWILLYNPF